MKLIYFLLISLLFPLKHICAQESSTLSVNANHFVAPVASTMWGVFFEDINFGADGGLYAEMVKNRSFEFSKPLMGWKKIGNKNKEGTMLIKNRYQANASNPRFLSINLSDAKKGDVGLINEGFTGMGIKGGNDYDFSLMYATRDPGLTIHAELIAENNKIIGSGSFKISSSTDTVWQKRYLKIHAVEEYANANLKIWFEGTGSINVDMVSLFPKDTWKKRNGGLRNDMVQMLADMKPGFIRFPGGCIVEGIDLANRYQWKKTIGPVDTRQLIMNRWNVEMPGRQAPDYFQSFGLGFYEYFQLAEDIGAEPLPILNCGMACQFNSAEVVPLDQMDSYIQDAIDLVEFANGGIDTHWGKKRSDMGHPLPFDLKYIGIGNENWGPQYIERAKMFQMALKKTHPEIQLIFSSGTDPESERFKYLDTALRVMHVDVIDEHYYRSPEWFLNNAKRYDKYSRSGPRIFAGEYAAHVKGAMAGPDRNIWQAAVAEAAYMTGLERNAGIVKMASYAPLFANEKAWQWAPDLIWTNNLQIYGSPSYQVQKLFSTNKGTHVIEVKSDGSSSENEHFASSVIDTVKKEIIIKIVNSSSSAVAQSINISSPFKLKPMGELDMLCAALSDKNSFQRPQNIEVKTQRISIQNNQLKTTLPASSFTVLKVKYR